MNTWIGMGRLTADPEARQAGTTEVCGFTIAIDRRPRPSGETGEPTADFIPCVCFGKTAEFAEKYLHKGTKVVAQGRIRVRSYNNREGRKVTATEIVVDQLEFAESKAKEIPPKETAPKD